MSQATMASSRSPSKTMFMTRLSTTLYGHGSRVRGGSSLPQPLRARRADGSRPPPAGESSRCLHITAASVYSAVDFGSPASKMSVKKSVSTEPHSCAVAGFRLALAIQVSSGARTLL